MTSAALHAREDASMPPTFPWCQQVSGPLRARCKLNRHKEFCGHCGLPEPLLFSTGRPFSTGESWCCTSWFGQWSPDLPEPAQQFSRHSPLIRGSFPICRPSPPQPVRRRLGQWVADEARVGRGGVVDGGELGGGDCLVVLHAAVEGGGLFFRCWIASRRGQDRLRYEILTETRPIPNSRRIPFSGLLHSVVRGGAREPTRDPR